MNACWTDSSQKTVVKLDGNNLITLHCFQTGYREMISNMLTRVRLHRNFKHFKMSLVSELATVKENSRTERWDVYHKFECRRGQNKSAARSTGLCIASDRHSDHRHFHTLCMEMASIRGVSIGVFCSSYAIRFMLSTICRRSTRVWNLQIPRRRKVPVPSVSQTHSLFKRQENRYSEWGVLQISTQCAWWLNGTEKVRP